MTYFFNTTYEGNDIPKELINLYRYVQTGESHDDFTNMLDKRVKELRRNEEMRSDYMRELTLAMDLRDEGREEERANTEKEKQRADAAEQRADNAERLAKNALNRAETAEAQVSELKAELEAVKKQLLLLSKQ